MPCEDDTYAYYLQQGTEVDRRFSKTLPRLELDPALVDRIITLSLELENSESMLHFRPFITTLTDAQN